MKQVFQHLDDGVTEVADVPCPEVQPGCLLIRSHRTLVSSGTERMLVDFGKATLLRKARSQPEKVKLVLDKIRSDGVAETVEAVRRKLKEAIPLGYSNVGTVLETGAGVRNFRAGDRVVSNGSHAEIVNVPTSLCARVPESVTDDAAAFTVLAAVGLQGIRLAQPTLGEALVVSGLGLIGLLTVQLLRAQGCRVLGIDFDPERLRLAREFGAQGVDLSAGEDPIAAAEVFSRGRGVDAVIVTAATDSSEPVHQAARMCRKRGRIVLVGVTGLKLSRADFYEKELSFQVSCSYGPGRYDPEYEEKGHDYPVGFVRWTAQRNFEAVLDMIASKRIDVETFISHRFPVEEAGEAYRVIGEGVPSLGILLEYPVSDSVNDRLVRKRSVTLAKPSIKTDSVSVGFIGSGNYATATLIPAFASTGVRLRSIASSGGASSARAGRKHGFEVATTDVDELLCDENINAIVVATRHDSHADLACAALEAGKHVFVEKPLALNPDELARLEKTYGDSQKRDHPPLLMIGFNRRFAPHVKKIHALIKEAGEPKHLIMTVNAGALPASHWTQDPAVGGGRIIGEGCHFIDLLRFLSGAPVDEIKVLGMRSPSDHGAPVDTVSFMLRFTDGSVGVVHYVVNGHRSFPKERLDVFCAGRVMHLDNFRKLRGYGCLGFRGSKLWRQDKGNAACVAAFVDAIRQGTPSPIPFSEITEATRISFEIAGVL